MGSSMLDDLFLLHKGIIGRTNFPLRRYFLKKNSLDNRFSIIVGQRGVGKTTAMIQYIRSFVGDDLGSRKALYVPVDHFKVIGMSLYEIAEDFFNFGGALLCFDEIHKYQNWSKELKSIYDSFPELKLIASGSSALEIHKGSHDLSRRAIIFKMHGLSFREFVELKYDVSLSAFGLNDLLASHERYAMQIIEQLRVSKLKVLPLFDEYLRCGYFPYFLEHPDESLYLTTIVQGIHTTIESDLLAIYPRLAGASVKKIKHLLAVIARSVPFIPDMRRLKTIIEVGDERTLKTYLKYLDDAAVITCLSKENKSIRALEKPEKIYLNNPNQAFALCDRDAVDIGSLRELFFVCSLADNHSVSIPAKGDFCVDRKWLFEIGGKRKSFNQIKDIPNSFLAIDNVEQGIGNKIPLWLFGFLY